MSRRRNNESRRFWVIWGQVCAREKIRGTEEERHALYRQALGYLKPQRDFTHREWDFVFAALRKRLRGLNPEGPEQLQGAGEEGERRRLVYACEKLWPEAYIAEVAAGKFAWHADWRNLETPQLEDLRLTLTERGRARDRQAKFEAQQPKLDLAPAVSGLVEEEPF